MNQNRKKKIEAGRYLIIMSAVLSVLFLGLMLFDAYSCLNHNLSMQCAQKEEYLEALIDNGNYQADVLGKNVEEGMIDFIEREYPTSASDFCFVAVDGRLIFVRDRNASRGLDQIGVDEYFHLEEESVAVGTGKNSVRVLINGSRYYISRCDIDTGNRVITVGVCVSESYLIAESNFDLLIQHIVLYMVLFSVAFISTVIFLAHRDKENHAMEKQLSEQLIENRKLIERLGEQIEAKSDMDYQRENGFCTKEVVKQVLEKLTEEQRKKSCRISIRLENNDPHLIVRCSVLLERMKVNKTVCCLWEKDEFLVVLLNTGETDAQNFIRQFLLQYQRMFQEDAEHIRISIGVL